jgi:uncharacterized membrane protein
MATNTKGDKMHKIEDSIECDVPCSVAYGQWTQFEDFPEFMANVEQVEQLDDTHLHWVASIAGKRKEWDAEIVEQEPDRIISWKSTSGTTNNGAVTFEDLGNDCCKVKLMMTYAPETFTEKAGAALGIVKGQVAADLRRFKEFVEGRRMPTGTWRGEVHDGQKGRTHGRGRDGRTPADALATEPASEFKDL